MLTEQNLAAAEALVYQHMNQTPAYAWPLLCKALACEVWVKHENHTPTGAFKVRGGLTFMDALGDEPGDLVTATRGNHGQSIPYAARLYGRKVHVYVPQGNSEEKNAAMRAWGAQLHVAGVDFDEARLTAERHAAEQGGIAVPSFHEALVRGVATYGKEFFNQAGPLDVVYVPIGMGSGAVALCQVRDLLNLNTEIVGVVSNAADAMALSLEQGRIVETPDAVTFADGVATRVPHPQAFDVLSRRLSRVVRVRDDEVAEAVRLLYRTTHNVAEGAGAAATAALAQDLRNGVVHGQGRYGVVLTGGNIDTAWFSDILAGGTPSVQV